MNISTMQTIRTQKPPSGKQLGAWSLPSLAEFYAMGRSLREKCPRSSHAVWKAPANRPDPLRLLEQDNKGRIPQMIPIRYGRLVRTPFTFYRGAALNMAADLASTPTTGLRVQTRGRRHLMGIAGLADFYVLESLGQESPHPSSEERKVIHHQNF